ncbi:hypothetical protein H0H92_010209, partial [Tricholoma furcatifolium]
HWYHSGDFSTVSPPMPATRNLRSHGPVDDDDGQVNKRPITRATKAKAPLLPPNDLALVRSIRPVPSEILTRFSCRTVVGPVLPTLAQAIPNVMMANVDLPPHPNLWRTLPILQLQTRSLQGIPPLPILRDNGLLPP